MNVKVMLIAAVALSLPAGAQTAGSQTSTTAGGPAATNVAHTTDLAANRSSAAESTGTVAQAGRAKGSAQQATNVSAELTKSIDSKHARVGDEVVAKTTQNARLADGTKLPKGSRLLGHVTQVQPKSREEKDGRLAFTFDHAVLRNGSQIPIHAVMQSLAAPAPVAAGSGDLMGSGEMAGGPMMASGGGMAGGGGRGGLLGGGSAGSAMLGSTSAATGRLAGGTASGLNSASSMTSVSRSGMLAQSAAGSSLTGQAMPVGNLSGVTFSTLNASGSASRGGVNGSAGGMSETVLSGRGKNVDLAGGSQMTFSLTPQ